MRKGKASERVAEEILKGLGFEILERNKEVTIDGKKVAEVDLVLKPPNKPLAVEVKAGKVDVSAVRQAYANAGALDMIPMVVGSGWANEEARLLAEKLGVKSLMFEDMYVTSREELYAVVKQATLDAIAEVAEKLEPSEEACEVAEAEEPKEVIDKLKRFGSANWKVTKAIAKLSCLLWRLARG